MKSSPRYTRKKMGGHLTPRKVPMTQKLFAVLSQRYAQRDPSKPWVFWHTYWSSKMGEKCTGPYQDRKKIMATLCRKAGVPYFRFRALRHAGASLMEGANVPIGSSSDMNSARPLRSTCIVSGSRSAKRSTCMRKLGEFLTRILTQCCGSPKASQHRLWVSY